MSWDLFAMHLPPEIKRLSDLPKDFAPSPIGPRSEIIAKLSALYPECDFSDPSWGSLALPGCHIEFSLGSRDKSDSDELKCFVMHVRGDERAPNVVAHILGELGLRAFDPSSKSGIFEQDPVSRSESFERWRAYRAQITRIRPG
jgi:hypothetical protein